jgi:hypothetical protein
MTKKERQGGLCAGVAIAGYILGVVLSNVERHLDSTGYNASTAYLVGFFLAIGLGGLIARQFGDD